MDIKNLAQLYKNELPGSWNPSAERVFITHDFVFFPRRVSGALAVAQMDEKCTNPVLILVSKFLLLNLK
ncbi:MAG: hypothetical protein LC658_03715, partial [Bacteroidales bacterium]|nr:hypothetical protein [Bacteroidales bacterium]